MIAPGTTIYWTPDDPAAADKARAFCQSRGLTPDEARIVRRDVDHMGKMICVETKVKCSLRLQSKPNAG